MRLRTVVSMAALAALLAPALPAWNHVGHKAVAGLAYQRLTKKARARVDALIRRHPDYALFTQGAPSDEKEKARYVFMQSAYWPDTIKGDPRFYDEAKSDAAPTPVLPGFSDMKQRRNWHYINVAFSNDGTPVPDPPPVNVLSQLKMILAAVGGDAPAPGSVPAEQDPVYLLPWLLHLAGDIHQPLHCATRYKKDQVNPANGKPWSDLGGNTVNVVGAFNLHAFWDDALGIADTPTFIDGLIKFLDRMPKEKPPTTDPGVWVQEGFKLSKEVVYSFGETGGSREDPIRFEETYVMRAKDLARKRAALAGHRIAVILNRTFDR
ncbi:MAG: S1/P1 nuclease [Bryobacteraceae bacterium]